MHVIGYTKFLINCSTTHQFITLCCIFWFVCLLIVSIKFLVRWVTLFLLKNAREFVIWIALQLLVCQKIRLLKFCSCLHCSLLTFCSCQLKFLFTQSMSCCFILVVLCWAVRKNCMYCIVVLYNGISLSLCWVSTLYVVN